MTIKQLARLARDLELTEMQRKFAEAYVLDWDGNATKAAQKAGSTHINSEGNHGGQVGYNWLQLPKVQKYIEALKKVAVEPTPGMVSTVVDLKRAIQILSDQAETRKPTKIKKGVVQMRNGDEVEWLPSKEKTYEPMRAAEILTNIYKPVAQSQDNSRHLSITLLEKADPKAVRDAVIGLLESGDQDEQVP